MFHIYATNRPGDVKAGSLGKVVEGYELKILPADAEGPGAPSLPPGEVGVLWVKGDSVAQCYFQDRDKSFETFHGHWCRTGDLFHMDEEGYLYFAGRGGDLFKASGKWVAPLEVEECLMQHPAIALAAVIPASDGGLLKPKAYVTLRSGETLNTMDKEAEGALIGELKAHVKANLDKHKYPRFIEILEEMPRNDRGKIDKKTLKAWEAKNQAEREAQREAQRDTEAGE